LEIAFHLLAISACQIAKEAMACLLIVYFPSNLPRFLSLTTTAVAHMQRGFLLRFLVTFNKLICIFKQSFSWFTLKDENHIGLDFCCAFNTCFFGCNPPT